MRILPLSALAALATGAGAQAQSITYSDASACSACGVAPPPSVSVVPASDAIYYAPPAAVTYAAPAPVYVEPAPVVAAPVYAEPAPVYVAPAPVYTQSAVTAPAALVTNVSAVAVAVAAAPVVAAPVVGGWGLSSHVELGAGASLPRGDLRDAAENGFAGHIGGGVTAHGRGVGADDRLRIAVEGDYLIHDAKVADKRAIVTGVFLTAEYEADLGGPIRPYVGVGVGAGYANLGEGVKGYEGDWGLAYKATVGASVDVTENLQLYGEYSYMGLPNVDLKRHGRKVGEADLDSHLVTVGLRYNF